MAKEEPKSSPRSKAGGVAVNELQKAIRSYRLHPPEHPACVKAIDEALEMVNKAIERYGPVEVEISRDGLTVDESPVVRTGDASSDLAILLFPAGIRSLKVPAKISRDEVMGFVKTVAARYADNESDATFEQDVATTLWQQELTQVEYRFHDPLSPLSINGRMEATLVGVARRIRELASTLGGPSAKSEQELKTFLEDAERRVEAAKPDDPSRGATVAERAAGYLASPAGAGRRALASELESVTRTALIERAASVLAWAAQQPADAPAPEDSASFLGAAALHALTQGDFDQATALLERANSADDGSGSTASAAVGRLGTDVGLLALASAIEKRAGSLSPEALQQRGTAILRHLGASAVPAAVKAYGVATHEGVRAIFRGFIVSKAGEAPESIVALTLHADRKVVEDALGILSTGGPHGPAWKQVEMIAKATDGKVRTQIALEIVERLSGEKERKDAVRVIANDGDKAKRLQAAEQLKTSGGGAKSFDELVAYVLEDRFAGRDEDEVEVVLSALTAVGKLRAVRVLQTLAEKKALLFRRNEVKKVALIAAKKLEQLKGRGGA